MQTSETTSKLFTALGAFHGAGVTVKKNAKNPHFNNTYANLGAVLDAIKEPLGDCGLTFTQMPSGDGALTTRLVHIESGEWLEDTMMMKAGQSTPQAFGSAITYARRYALCAILALKVEEDDGNAGSAAFVPTRAELERLLAATGHERVTTGGKAADMLRGVLKTPTREAFNSYVAKIERANAEYQFAAADSAA